MGNNLGNSEPSFFPRSQGARRPEKHVHPSMGVAICVGHFPLGRCHLDPPWARSTPRAAIPCSTEVQAHWVSWIEHQTTRIWGSDVQIVPGAPFPWLSSPKDKEPGLRRKRRRKRMRGQPRGARGSPRRTKARASLPLGASAFRTRTVWRGPSLVEKAEPGPEFLPQHFGFARGLSQPCEVIDVVGQTSKSFSTSNIRP